MTPQSLKIQADIEMKCFQFNGVLHIKVMHKAEAAGNDACPVKIKLVAPPLYGLTTQTLDKEQGIATLNKAIAACTEAIEYHKGKLAVKEHPRAVSERDDKLLAEHMAKLRNDNEEISGDEDSEEEEDTDMGEVDVENAGHGIMERCCFSMNMMVINFTKTYLIPHLLGPLFLGGSKPLESFVLLSCFANLQYL